MEAPAAGENAEAEAQRPRVSSFATIAKGEMKILRQFAPCFARLLSVYHTVLSVAKLLSVTVQFLLYLYLRVMEYRNFIDAHPHTRAVSTLSSVLAD